MRVGARDLRLALAIGGAALSLLGCSTTTAEPAPSASSPAPVALASASPMPASPSAASTSGVLAPPPVVDVSFSRLPAGAYPVHVHSRCSGSQAFHIITVGSLRIMAGGTGAIGVPRGYFGRGLCLIVYANLSLTAVLTTRPI